MTTLRQKLRKVGISPYPWKVKKGEIALLPISAQTLFKKGGLPSDIWELELRDEGWLGEDESLMDVLSTHKGLYRRLHYDVPSDIEPWDDTWTEEDFVHFFNN